MKIKSNKPKNLTKSNYYDDRKYWTASFVKGMLDCPAMAIAERKGKYVRPDTTALLVGSYVDSFFDGKKQFDAFNAEHTEIRNSRTGELKADFKKALEMIERCKSDKDFMEFLKGERQKIFVGKIGSIPFKCKMDFYLAGKRIVDLKTTKDFDPVYKEGEGKVSFASAYHYPLQMAIYQELCYQATGEKLPCYLACVTKQDPPDLMVIEIPQYRLDAELDMLKGKLLEMDAMYNGIVDVERCDNCAYCRQTRKVKAPTSLDDLFGEG